MKNMNNIPPLRQLGRLTAGKGEKKPLTVTKVNGSGKGNPINTSLLTNIKPSLHVPQIHHNLRNCMGRLA